MLSFRIWTPWIYSLWSHVNIYSSVVKMKRGQEGFWEANIHLHLQYVQTLMKDCSGKSRVYHHGSKTAMPPETLQFKFHPNQLPANIHRLPEFILTPHKLWELGRVRKWYNFNAILCGRTWGRVGPSQAMGSRRYYLKLTLLWSLM